MSKIYRGLFLFLFVFISGVAMAQETKEVTGKVTDADGAPVPGATVRVVGGRAGTATDENGEFKFTILNNIQAINVSAIGYQEQTVSLTGGPLLITLTRSGDADEAGQEVIVTGVLGLSARKRDLGYATTVVSNRAVNQANTINIANGLQGKVAGLNVTTINSGVFETVKINLRGIRSLTGSNNPMLLLDGVPTAISYLSSLNPNDIEDVNVLKGTSAAAIYGPDARNGVIVVVTKKGTRGAPVVTYGYSAQFQNVSFYPKFQTKFGSGGYGEYIPYENWSWGPAYDGSIKEVGYELEDGSIQKLPYSPTNDREKFFNTGLLSQHNLSFSAQDFYLSVQDAAIKGIVPDDENRKTGIRMNTSKTYGMFKASFDVNYIQSNYSVFDDGAMGDYNAGLNVGLNNGLMNLIFNTPAHIPLTRYKDFRNDPYATYDGYFTNYGHNPYFAIDNWRRKGKKQDLLSNLTLNLKPTDWLEFTYRVGMAGNTEFYTRTSKGITPTPYSVSHRGFKRVPQALTESSYYGLRLSNEFFGAVDKQISSDLRFKAIAGTYYRDTRSKNNNMSAANLIIPDLFNISSRTGEPGVSSSFLNSRLFSLYGSVGLNYKNWANIEIVGRNDKTSVLSLDNNSYFYPGVNASVVLSDALNIKNDFLNFLKVRASWNKTGNADISPYQLAATFSQGSGFPYGNLPGYSANTTTYTPDLKPEFINSSEVGIDAGFLNNRISLEATYYYQKNTNQIVSIRVSEATGYRNAFVNAASFDNKGFELDLKLNPLFNLGEVSFDFNSNFSYNDSKINSIYQDLDEIFAGGYNNFAANYAIKGYPAFVFKATDYLRDSDGRVIVDPVSGYPSADPSLKTYGRTQPLWIVGLNPVINYKSLMLSALFEYRGGHYAYHGIGAAMAWTGVSEATALYNRQPFVFPNSSIENPVSPGTYIPNTDVAVSNVNDFYTGIYRDVASNFLTSASSWRFRELALRYEVPVKIFGQQNIIKGLSVAVTGRNLLLWLPKENQYTDPDFNFTDGNTSGISDSAINPPVRTFGGNVIIRF